VNEDVERWAKDQAIRAALDYRRCPECGATQVQHEANGRRWPTRSGPSTAWCRWTRRTSAPATSGGARCEVPVAPARR
jgi:hypothetical protein